MTKNIRQYLIICFLITYISWGILAVYSNIEQISFSEYTWMYILYIIGVIAPAISAVIVQVKNKEHTLKEALLRIIQPSKNISDILLICIAVFSFDILPFLIYGGQQTASFINVFLCIPTFLIIGGLEEVGWRGYWLEHIITNTNWSRLKSALVIGIVWVIWHLPLFVIIGTYQQRYLNVGIFALWTIGFSFILTGIYLYRRNVLLCLLTHCLMNSFGEIFIPKESWLEAITKFIIGFTFFAFITYLMHKRQVTKQIIK